MKCLIIVPSLIRAGAETQAVDLANGLAERGHTVHLCCFEPQLDLQNRLLEQVRFCHAPRRSRYDLSFVVAITRLIDDVGIDVVLGVMQFAAMIGWMAALRSRRRPPVVAAVHTTVNQHWKAEIQDRAVYRFIFRRLPEVVFVCENQRDYWIRKFPELGPSSCVIYNGVDLHRFCRMDVEGRTRSVRESLGIPKAAFVFCCVAAFRVEKGHALLLEAFATLPKQTTLILVGDGVCRARIESQIQKFSLADRVRLIGNIPDVRPIIVASDATILASTAVETFSMAMLESMALGVPVIAPRIGGLAEAIEHADTGLLFSVGDKADLSRQMEELVARPDETRRMGERAAVTVGQRFSRETMINGYEAMLISVVLSAV